MDARDRHITVELLFRVFRGELPLSVLAERQRDHLHALSPECARAWEEYLAHRREVDRIDGGTEARERARYRSDEMARRLAADALAADAEVEELIDLDLEERERRVLRAYRRFRTPAFAERMIAEARTWLRHDPRLSLHLLEVARARLPRLDRTVYGEDLVERTAVRVLAHRANLLRVLGELPAADEAFAEVRARLGGRPTDDAALYAEVASLEGSLRLDQRRLEAAEVLLAQAAELYERVGDRGGLAKVTMQLGIVLCIAGQMDRAVPLFSQAVAATEPEIDLEAAVSARHNLVLSLCDLDRGEEANGLLDCFRPLYRSLDIPTGALWLHWAEGRVAAATGNDESALAHLRAARHGYMDRGLEYDASLVALDLAQIHLLRAETGDVQRLAAPMAQAFARRGVDREAARAVRLFQQAAASESVTLELIGRTRAALLRAGRLGPKAG